MTPEGLEVIQEIEDKVFLKISSIFGENPEDIASIIK